MMVTEGRIGWRRLPAPVLCFVRTATRAAVESLLCSTGRRVSAVVPVFELPGSFLPACAAADPHRVGVVLVHGFGSDAGAVVELQRALHSQGYPTLALTFGTFSGTLERFASRIDDAARTFLACAGVDSIVVIGHSLGGVAARWAATFGQLDEIACEIITVCSPHAGSSLAALPGLSRVPVLGRLMCELRPDSESLLRLAAAVRPGRARWVTYASEGDEFVSAASAALADPLLRAENRTVPFPVSHVGALRHPVMLAELAAEVDRAERELMAA